MSIKKLVKRFWPKKSISEEKQGIENEWLADSSESETESGLTEKSDQLVTEKPSPRETLPKKNGFPGCQTQFKSLNGSGRQQQLVIGLDLGTAFTKVVIAETRVAFAVPFPSLASEDNDYLLPGIMSISKDGECSLGHADKAARCITNLKMRLLQGDTDLSCKSEIAAFMALVLRYSRAWLLAEHSSTYKGTQLDWNVNVGLPTHNYHDDKLTKIYREIVESAWFISILSEPITLELATRVITERVSEDGINNQKFGGEDVGERALHPDSIGLFPEFVAQVTGYVRSPLRQSDLHSLVDVGAGTVDVTVFNVHQQDNEDKYPVFAKSVEPLGVEFLMLHRLHKGQYDGEWTPGAQDVPPSDSEFADMLGITADELKNGIDSPFREKLRKQIFGCLAHTKAVRYPRSQRWSTGVPMFWCGGGVKTEFYSQLINLIEGPGPYRISRAYLPRPERLQADGMAESEYDRLSVAYGLSHDQFDIGEIRRTSEVLDDVHDEKPTSGICPACHGTGGPRGNDCDTCGGSGIIH